MSGQPAPRAEELSPLKRALLAISELERRLAQSEQAARAPGAEREPIAVIGLGCRFPGAASPEDYWRLLREGRDAVSEVPAERWDADAWFEPGAPGKCASRWGGFLHGVDGFDAGLFGIAPREAVSMDPQQRLLLETSWEALERAGQAPDRLGGSATGVFVGFSSSDYAQIGLWSGDPSRIDTYSASGGTASVASGRLSYFYGFQGPSLSVDTACSSSLVAVHLACQSLRAGECRMALAGGVYLLLSPLSTVALSTLRMMAADGRCKAFDARADGFVQGEGCGVLVLKRLADALAGRDPILAVLRGSAVNQDGRSGGLTAPNGPAQEAVLRAALAAAGTAAAAVDFVETHGTGTALGDPIEAGALAAVYGQGRAAGRPLWIGSVKSNLGHLAAAAGIAGLSKAILALQHGEIPPHLHLTTPNPLIPWSELPLSVPRQAVPWPSRAAARRLAGVSSFGFSGTNAHVVVEEAPAQAGGGGAPLVGMPAHPLPQLLPLAARGAAELDELTAAWADRLAAEPALPFADVAFTAGAGRAHLPHRRAVVAASATEAAAALTAALARPAPPLPAATRAPRIAFLFAGQGAVISGVSGGGGGGGLSGAGRGLLETEAPVREVVERCDAWLPALDPAARPGALRALLLGDHAPAAPGFAQEALFALGAGLAALWRSWGIDPVAVLGHSLGEIAAAVAAGALDLEPAFAFVAARARALRRLPPGGAMATVLAGEDAVAEVVARKPHLLAVAAVNGPRQTVISGAAAALDEALAELSARGVHHRPLPAERAFHSPLIGAALDEIGSAARRLVARTPRIRLISGLTGAEVGAEQLAADAYWQQQARQTVRFADGLERLRELGCTAMVEIGPAPQLSAIGRQAAAPGDERLWLPSLRPRREARATLLDALGELYVRGATVSWEGLHAGAARRRLGSLPTYPFRRQRYWLDGPAPRPPGRGGHHPLLGRRLDLALPGTVFQSTLCTASPPLLAEHRLFGLPVVSGSAWLVMALDAAGGAAAGGGAVELRDVVFEEPCILDEHGVRQVQVILDPAEGGGAGAAAGHHRQGGQGDQEGQGRRFRIAGQVREGSWRSHANGFALNLGGEAPVPGAPRLVVETAAGETLEGEAFYAMLAAAGIDLGGEFRWLAEIRQRPGAATAQLRAPRPGEAEPYCIHPGLLDSCFLVLGAASLAAGERPETAYLPLGLERLTLLRRPRGALHCSARLREGSAAGGASVGDLIVTGEDGAPVLEVAGLIFKRAGREALEREGEHPAADRLYRVEWRPLPLPAPGPLAGRWLVIGQAAEHESVGAALAHLLRSRGASCTLLPAAGPWHVRSAGNGEPDGQAQPTDGATYDGVVYLATLSRSPDALTVENAGERWLSTTCASVLRLIQTLAANGGHSPRMWLVTRGAQAAGGSVPDPWAAPLWGLGDVAGLEHPSLRCCCIDLDPAQRDPAASAATILGELTTAETRLETRLAWRGGERLAARLVRWQGSLKGSSPEQMERHREPPAGNASHPHPAPRNEPAARQGPGLHPAPRKSTGASAEPPALREDGLYLVSGGLGALGLEVAGWLVEHGARHLALLGRRPPRPAAQQRLAALTAAGATVRVLAADVARRGELAAALASLRPGPPLAGVVHAAGVLDDGVIANQTWERFSRVLAPKVAGAWNLHQLTAGQQLDFFVLFSSAAALTGAAGQSSYAAANSFLDALAHLRRDGGLPALSVNWGPWGGGGMAAALDERGTRRLGRRGIGALAPREALAWLGRLMADPVAPPQVAVLPVDWPLFLADLAAGEPPAFLSDLAGAGRRAHTAPAAPPAPSAPAQPGGPWRTTTATTSGWRERLEGTAARERPGLLLAYARVQVARALGLAAAAEATGIDPAAPLGPLGLDSLMAVELKNRIEGDLGVGLSTVFLLKGPSLHEIADQLRAALAVRALAAGTGAEARAVGTTGPAGPAGTESSPGPGADGASDTRTSPCTGDSDDSGTDWEELRL